MMKKIIILVIVAVIPILIAINGNSKITLKDKLEKEGYVINPKDSLWEFVKYEIEKGRIDLDIDYQKRYKEPILFSLENATKEDSLLVERMMDEFKDIFSKKKIKYYIDFTGEKYVLYKLGDDWGYSDIREKDELYSYNNVISFKDSKSFISYHGSFDEQNVIDSLKVGNLNYAIRENTWNRFVAENKLGIFIPKEIKESEKVLFIKNVFLESYWQLKFSESENHSIDYREIHEKPKNYEEDFVKISAFGFKKDYNFLFEKLFAKDFKDQFTAYMHKTYPWQYASVFIDKDKARKNANTLVIVLGILLLIFSISIFWNKKTALTYYDYFFAVFVFSAGFGSLSSLYNFIYHIDVLNLSIFENLIFLLNSSVLCLLVSFILWQIEKQINRKIQQFGYRLLLKLVATFSILYLPYVLVLEIKVLFLDNGFTVTKSVTDLQFLFLVLGITLIRGLVIYLNHYAASQLRQKDVEISNLKALQAQSETKLLQSQINPHFLYNSLNSIASLNFPEIG